MDIPIALINPPPAKIIEEYDNPPYGHIGLAYLGAALRRRGLDCRIFDAKLGRLSYADVMKSVTRLRPRIVGITAFTFEIDLASRLAKEIKEGILGVKVVIGGVHASSLPAETLRKFSSYDFLIKGEGENSFVRLSESIINDREDIIPMIKGLGYRKDGSVVITPQDNWIEDLDRIDFPAWDLFPRLRAFPVIASRGCPYKCIFCARMLGEKNRVRSPENVIEELRILQRNFGAKKIHFYDETFGLHRGWLLKFLGLLSDSPLSRKLRWVIGTRAQLIDEDILQMLKKAGCRRIEFGVESGDEGILKASRKGEKKEDFIRAARLIRSSGLESRSYYILGHPNETKETAMNTINFAARLNTDSISIGIMIPYPGTEVARLAANGEGGYKRISADWTEYNKQLGSALELESLKRTDLIRLQLLGYIKFYARNFKVWPCISTAWRHRRLVFAIVGKYAKGLFANRKEKREDER